MHIANCHFLGHLIKHCLSQMTIYSTQVRHPSAKDLHMPTKKQKSHIHVHTRRIAHSVKSKPYNMLAANTSLGSLLATTWLPWLSLWLEVSEMGLYRAAAVVWAKCPSVRLSVCQTRTLCQNKRNLCPHCYTIWKKEHPSFPTRRIVGRGRSLLSEILGQTDPVRAKTPIFNRYLLVAL